MDVIADGVGEPVACVASTFEFDADFFETELLPRFLGLRFDHTENELTFLIEREEKLSEIESATVLVDIHKVDPGQTTLRWDQVPIAVPGTQSIQHSKISVLAWERLIRLIVGSPNLTRPGYRRNREVFAALDFYDDSESPPRRVLADTSWYEHQIAALIPSKSADRQERLRHPKIAATVKHAVDLWLGGEKVLVFCVYRETSRALYKHIEEELEERLISLAGRKLGLDPRSQRAEIENRLERIARRISEEGRPFNEEVRQILRELFQQDRFAILRERQTRLTDVLAAYFRSPSFIARYLPLEDPDLREAWELGEGRPEVINRGRAALRRCIRHEKHDSGQTIIARVYQFLEYAVELAERAKTRVKLDVGEKDDEADNPLKQLVDAVTVYSNPRRRTEVDNDAILDEEDDDGSYRVVPIVRMVFGDTKADTRDRVALAFNSPLFPEVLVSSSVMGEGIDLHRFCRHVIHHDGFWNPSTLEQQTGRLDRIRSWAEHCRRPIRVYQPFIAGGADEKMFRVLRDRERWFQVVMGQKFEFDEAKSDEFALRAPLPTELAEQLTFELARWRG